MQAYLFNKLVLLFWLFKVSHFHLNAIEKKSLMNFICGIWIIKGIEHVDKASKPHLKIYLW